MTRIDIFPATMLLDFHVQSNHREIKRIPNRLKVRLEKNKFDDIPAPFYHAPCKKHPEGKFYELYWVDKGYYTYKRYLELHREALKRGMNVSDFSGNWVVYAQKKELWQDLQPSKEQFDLMEERILSRCRNAKKPLRYYKKEISFEDYVNNIWNPQKKELFLR